MTIDTSNLLSRLAGPVNVNVGNNTIFVGSTNHIYTIRNILIVNASAGSTTISVGINGVAAANLIIPSTTISANGRLSTDDMIVLSGTDTLQCSISGNAVTITVVGLDQS